MLTPSYLLHAVEPAEEIAEKLHTDILNRIIERIMLRLDRGDGYILTAVDKWQIETLQEAGYLLEDIQKEIAKATGLMRTEIKEAMEHAGVTALEYDDSLYRAAGLDPVPLTQSPYMVRLLQDTYEQTLGEWTNFTSTTANAVQQTFINLCDNAYMQVMSGAISRTQATKEAVDSLISDGVYVTYPTGHRDTIETATARAIRTGIAQGSARIQLARMDEMGVDLVIVSSHLGARPSHAEWQGKVYSRGGEYKGKYPDFVTSTGYGTVTGLDGANCRHSFSAWWEGLENPFTQYDSEENRKEYEKEQRQRALERRIRKSKREVMNYRAAMENAQTDELRADMEAKYQRKAATLQRQNKEYNAYCEETGLKRQSDRIAVAKWDRSQAAKATAAAKKYNSRFTSAQSGGKISAVASKRGTTKGIGVQFFANKGISKQTDRQIAKSINSWRSNIEEHRRKLENPAAFDVNWGTKTKEQQDGLIKHWEKEIENFRNNISEAENIIKERGHKQ